jgi:glutathione synthase/RimK-type ligase-like ATP-grasp enzyme
MKPICILTPDQGYEEDWRKDAAHFEALFGDALSWRCWTDPGDLGSFGLILPLLSWGYQRDPARWARALDGWEAKQLPCANPVALLRWNTDKCYLFDLEAAGLSIVPTQLAAVLSDADLSPAFAAFGAPLVIKPTISGGADGTYLLEEGTPIPDDVKGRMMLLQPMMTAIANEGEFSLFLFDGQFSHAILKRPAAGDFRVQEQFGGREVAVTPPEDALTLASATLAVLPAMPLYARVDLVRDSVGAFRLMELEVIEPSLFLNHAPDGGAMFAEAVRRRITA